MPTRKCLRFVSDDLNDSLSLQQQAIERGYLVSKFAMVSELLEHLGPTFDGEELLEQTLATYWQRYAPVVIDLLEDCRGLPHAVEAIKSHDAGIPVIVLARHASLLTVSECRQAGVEILLLQPVDPESDFWPAVQLAECRLQRMAKALALAGSNSSIG
jgi:CheY-like chemotaxis protein